MEVQAVIGKHERNWFAYLGRYGAEPGDSQELRLQKTLLLASSLMLGILAVIWGLVYLSFSEPLAAAIPLLYACLSTISIAIYVARHRYQLFRSSQLLLSLLLPFFLMIALGGIVNSSAVVLWSLMSPLGALLFANRRRALYWFIAYLVLVFFGVALGPIISDANSLPRAVVTLFFGLNIGGVSAVTFVLLQNFMSQKDEALELLRAEQAKSEGLLLNVLPAQIAEVLKDGVHTIADQCDEVSVLFADVVGFTPLSESLPPQEVVALLDEAFTYFDSLVAEYGVEKIRTIGDNYMVAAGVPIARPDHAQVLTRIALKMNSFVTSSNPPLRFRLGINSGPAIAGVIGTAKFHYDLWGDMVNTASRMESHGQPGKIQITQATYERIADQFVCRPRGLIEVKGKGKMPTWFVEVARE